MSESKVKQFPLPAEGSGMVLELRYLGEAIAWVGFDGSFTPANDDWVWLNVMLHQRHAA